MLFFNYTAVDYNMINLMSDDDLIVSRVPLPLAAAIKGIKDCVCSCTAIARNY